MNKITFSSFFVVLFVAFVSFFPVTGMELVCTTDRSTDEFSHIAQHLTLQSFGRLKAVNKQYNEFIDFGDNAVRFNWDKLSSVLMFNDDTCNKALTSCAHSNKLELFCVLVNKLKSEDRYLWAESGKMKSMGYKKKTSLYDMFDIFLMYRGISREQKSSDINFLRTSLLCGNIDALNRLLHCYRNAFALGHYEETLTPQKLFEFAYVDEFYRQINPFTMCTIEKRANTVKTLVAHGFDCNMYKGDGNKTLLMHACAHRHQEMVEFLVSKGADLNAQDRDGNTALHMVSPISIGKDTIKMLVDKGADCTLLNNKGETAINFHEACFAGMTDVVTCLLEKNRELLNSQDHTISWGPTGLHIAIQLGHKELVQVLLNYGANLSIKNKFKKSSHSLLMDYEFMWDIPIVAQLKSRYRSYIAFEIVGCVLLSFFLMNSHF